MTPQLRHKLEGELANENIVALSAELGIHPRLLYKWRDQLEPVESGEGPPPQNSRESTLRKEVSQLKRVLADKTLELDFFKGALQKSRGSTSTERRLWSVRRRGPAFALYEGHAAAIEALLEALSVRMLFHC